MRRLIILLAISTLLAPVYGGSIDREIDELLPEYFKIQAALASDTTDGVEEAAQSLQKKAKSITTSEPELQAVQSQLVEASKQIQAQDLETARNTFFSLSKPVLVYLNKFHAEKSRYARYYCGMAKKGWVQSDMDIKNPYYGSSMLRCGKLIQ